MANLPLQAYIGLVIGIILAAIVGFAIYSIVISQLPGKIDDTTLSAFDEVVRVLNGFDEGKYTESKRVDLNINNPFVIVGFSYGGGIGEANLQIPSINVASLESPCRKTCVCICPYTETITRHELFGKSCFTHKKRCVEFKNLKELKGDKLISDKGYFFLTSLGLEEKTTPYTIKISGDKETGEINFKLV